MKRKISLVVALMLMTLTVFGCGKREELENTPSSSLLDIINDEEVTEEECPEGYVYDYQVSMEPIPEEIAALGGDVCGTIHAYPTRIEIALAQQEIENDVALKEQNEIYLVAIRQYLEDKYGGEFEIEPIATKTLSYACTEKSTDKVFILLMNPLYGKQSMNITAVNADSYFYEENASAYEDDLNNIIENTIPAQNVYRFFQEELGEYRKLKIYIAIFCESEPVLVEEQEMIIDMYEQIYGMKKNSDCANVEIIITYFPSNYEEVITTQYNSLFVDDILRIGNERADKLIEKGEVYAQFRYNEGANEKDETSLNKIVIEGKENFDSGIVLPYWR